MAQSLANRNRLLEKYVQVVREDGLNTNKNVNIGINGSTPNVWVGGNLSVGGTITGASGATTITSSSANALAVGPTGATNPSFNVDASTASAVAGLNIKAAVTGGTVAVATLDSGSANNLTIDALGTGTIKIGSISTGNITIGKTGASQAVIVPGAASQAFTVGPNGATNAALTINTSLASAVTGINIIGRASGAGVTIIGAISGGDVDLNTNSAGQLWLQRYGTGGVSINRAGLAPPLLSSTTASLGTTQNSTPTAAQLLGGVVTQTGATGAGTVTTPTGSVLSAAVTNVTVGDTFQCLYANLGGGFNEVITAGASGMTVIGNATVPSGKTAVLLFVNTASNTWNCYVTVSA